MSPVLLRCNPTVDTVFAAIELILTGDLEDESFIGIL